MIIELKEIGEFIIEKGTFRSIWCTIKKDEFLRKFGNYFVNVPLRDINAISDAINYPNKEYNIKDETAIISAFTEVAKSL